VEATGPRGAVSRARRSAPGEGGGAEAGRGGLEVRVLPGFGQLAGVGGGFEIFLLGEQGLLQAEQAPAVVAVAGEVLAVDRFGLVLRLTIKLI